MPLSKKILSCRIFVLTLLLLPSSALAAPPANDNFANATVIAAGGGQVNGTNVDAIKEAGEPNHHNIIGGKSAWWRWTPSADSSVTIDTFGSNFDTVLAVYTGTSVSTLTLVASNDDASDGSTSRVAFTATAETIYRIAVDGYDGDTGSITLTVNISGPPPDNDSFSGAIAVPTAGGTTTGSNINASKEVGEPLHAGNEGGRSVWWHWTPAQNMNVTIATTGSNFDTILAVYTGPDVANLISVAANDDEDPQDLVGTSRVTFGAFGGETYRIAVDGFGGVSGDISLLVQATAGVRPVNDDFAGRTAFPATGGTLTGSNIDGTKEAGEPNHANNIGGKSVWWTWTPAGSSAVSISTAGSNFDTLLAVYTGSALNGLTLVAANDDDVGLGGTSRVNFDATQGVPCQIAIDGWDGDSGSITITIDTVVFQPGPPDANQATGVGVGGFVASWNSVSGATGYRLDVSTSSTFASFLPGYQGLDLGNSLSRSVSGLNAGITYYYRVRAYNPAGEGGNSQTISVTLQVPEPTGPTFSAQPPSHSIAADGTVIFTSEVSGVPIPTLQWQISTDGGVNWSDVANGGKYSGATTSSLRVTSATTAMNGQRFRVVATNAQGSTTSDAGVLNVVASAGSRLINLSTRASAGSGDSTLIMGFFIAGTGSKTLLIRGVGPQLGLPPHNVPSVVQNPSLTVYSGETPIGSNDNWDAGDASAFAAVGAFSLTPGSNDAAMIITLPQGGYTVHLLNPGNVAEALIEVYDLSRDLGTRLVNLSCRLNFNPGQTVIAGTFLLGGQKPLLVRNAGPGLAFALPEFIQPGDVLPDPRLTVYSGQTVIGENNDWDSALAPYFSAVGAFGFENGSKDAAIRSDFTQGGYTVHATGTGGSGIALIEIYESP